MSQRIQKSSSAFWSGFLSIFDYLQNTESSSVQSERSKEWVAKFNLIAAQTPAQALRSDWDAVEADIMLGLYKNMGCSNWSSFEEKVSTMLVQRYQRSGDSVDLAQKKAAAVIAGLAQRFERLNQRQSRYPFSTGIQYPVPDIECLQE